MLKDTRHLPREKPERLVVLLHGVGADGADLISLGGMWAPLLPRTAFIAPDGPAPYDMAPFGRQWFSLREWTEKSIEAGLKHAQGIVDAYLDTLLKEFSLPSSRLVLAGFSQGTMTALYTGLRRGEPLAGILGYSGALFGAAELARPPKSAPPVCLVHGAEDDVVPCAASQQAAAQLAALGYSASFHPLAGLAHGISDEGLALGAAFLQRTLK